MNLFRESLREKEYFCLVFRAFVLVFFQNHAKTRLKCHILVSLSLCYVKLIIVIHLCLDVSVQTG